MITLEKMLESGVHLGAIFDSRLKNLDYYFISLLVIKMF